MKTLLRQIGAGGTLLLSDGAILDRLLALAWRCYDEGWASGAAVPWADRVSHVFGHLLEDVTEAVLGPGYCTLHRARLKAVQGAATFFCRVKSRNAVAACPPRGSGDKGGSTAQGSPKCMALPTSGASESAPPAFMREELSRRLQTYLWTLHTPPAQEKVDTLRKRDVVESLAGLHSPLMPLDITLRSVVLPLLEFLCCDMLMCSRVGDEVRARLEADIDHMHEEEEQQADLFQTVGAFWKLATAGQAAAAREAGLGPRLGSRVEKLIRWVRAKAVSLRMGCSLEELLCSVDPALREALRQQEYESAEHFLQVFKGFEDKGLRNMRVPCSASSCGGEQARPRECSRFDLVVTQVLKDVSRERLVVDGEEVLPSDVQQRLAALLLSKATAQPSNGLDVVEAVRRVLQAASRTVFGGDTFFLVRELFGGEGVVVAPAQQHQPGEQGQGRQDPITITVQQVGPAALSVVVRSINVYSIYSGLDLSRQALVNLTATVTEVLPMEVREDELQEAAAGRSRTISITAALPQALVTQDP